MKFAAENLVGMAMFIAFGVSLYCIGKFVLAIVPVVFP